MRELLTPLLIASAVTTVILLPFAHASRASAARWAGAAALSAGFVAGFLARAGWRALPPAEHWHWVGLLAAVGGLAAALQCVNAIPRAIRVVAVLGFIAFFGWRVVPAFVEPAAHRPGWQIAAAVTLLALWVAPAWVARSMGSRTTAILLWAHATGLAIFLVIAHTALLGQVAGISAACLGVFVLLALWRPQLPFPQTVAPLAAAIVLALALTAQFSASLSHTPYLLVAIAPLILVLGRFVGGERLGGWRAGLVHIMLVLVPVATAIVMALRADAAAGADAYAY